MVKIYQVANKSIELITKENIEPRQSWQISAEDILCDLYKKGNINID